MANPQHTLGSSQAKIRVSSAAEVCRRQWRARSTGRALFFKRQGAYNSRAIARRVCALLIECYRVRR